MAEIKQLTGDMTLRVMYPEVNKNITNVNAEIVGHKASGQAHAADAITYSGNVPAASVKEAIDKTDQRISSIVAQAGDSNTEIVDARGGAPVLGERLNGLDAQLADNMDQLWVLKNLVNAETTEEGYDIFVVAGQSNAVGWSTPKNLLVDGSISKVYQYKQDGTIAIAEYPLDHWNDGRIMDTTIGFALSFCREYLREYPLSSKRKILLVPCGFGGTSFISGRWQPTGDLYLAMERRIKEVMNLRGFNRLRAVLWHQGEGDILEGNTVTVYKSQLSQMISNLRDAVKFDVPFIFGQFSRPWCLANKSTVQPFLDMFAELSSQTINSYLVKNNELEGDTVTGEIHFSASSERILGQRYFSGYQNIKNQPLEYRCEYGYNLCDFAHIQGNSFNLKITNPISAYAPVIFKKNDGFIQSITVDVTDKTRNFLVIFGYDTQNHYTCLAISRDVIGYVYDVSNTSLSSGHTLLSEVVAQFSVDKLTISVDSNLLLTAKDDRNNLIYSLDLSLYHGAFETAIGMGISLPQDSGSLDIDVTL